MSLFNRGREIEIESSINPQSAFLLPFQLYLNHLVSSGSVGRLPYISTPTR